jgi:hypothetical protein
MSPATATVTPAPGGPTPDVLPAWVRSLPEMAPAPAGILLSSLLVLSLSLLAFVMGFPLRCSTTGI